MKLQIKQVVMYSVQSACSCTRDATRSCGINYRVG
jgi:hypothetical protein